MNLFSIYFHWSWKDLILRGSVVILFNFQPIKRPYWPSFTDFNLGHVHTCRYTERYNLIQHLNKISARRRFTWHFWYGIWNEIKKRITPFLHSTIRFSFRLSSLTNIQRFLLLLKLVSQCWSFLQKLSFSSRNRKVSLGYIRTTET